MRKLKLSCLKWLCIALVLMLAGSFFASMFNSSFFSVRVQRIWFDTERGTIEALLYMPRDAGAHNPRPVIVTTHGYLNSKEMQDLTAIEMSRRGYIVLAIDMYDHGGSRWDADIPVGGQFATFWIHSMFDAAQHVYAQPWAARDEHGNGRIAVTGHSMGGFSSVIAMYFDELQSLQSGVRMIEAGLPVGADLSFAASVAPIDQLLAAMGSRPVGFIAGLYDEFFFNDPAATAAAGGSVQRSYWPATPVGRQFLGLDPAGVAGQSLAWHHANSGELILEDNVVRGSETGLRIIYAPNEIHPWNHFSSTSVNYKIGFFEGVFPNPANTGVTGQMWQWKVVFNFVTLVGFFMLIPPVMTVFLHSPFYKLAITKKTDPVPMGDKGYQKAIFWLFIAVGALLPAYLVPYLLERRADELAVLGNVYLVLGAAALVCGIFFLNKGYRVSDSDKSLPKYRSWGTGGVVFALICGINYLVVSDHANLLALSGFFVAPTVNVIAYWALVSAGIAALILTAFYFLSRKLLGAKLENYGVKANAAAITASFFTAFFGVGFALAVIILLHAIFTVDARIWTLAVRAHNFEHLRTTLRYAPFFFIFYFFNTIAINANARGRKFKYLIAIVLNIGGLVLWVGIHYAQLFSTGVAWYPTMALNTILLFGLIPCLAVAAVYALKLYEKTNNVYLAAFTNALLFTMVNVSNTAVFWNLI